MRIGNWLRIDYFCQNRLFGSESIIIHNRFQNRLFSLGQNRLWGSESIIWSESIIFHNRFQNRLFSENRLWNRLIENRLFAVNKQNRPKIQNRKPESINHNQNRK